MLSFKKYYLQEVALSNANVDKFNKKYQTNFTLDQLKDIFDRFNKQQPRLTIKDIFGYNSLQDLQSAIDVQSNKETIKSVKSNEVNVIINNDRLLVVEPLTENASVMYGANTKWCTAGKTNNKFLDYMLRISLVYFIDKALNTKYAIAYDQKSKQMEAFDQQDRSIPGKSILQLYNLNWDRDIVPKLVPMKRKLSTINGRYVKDNVERWYVNGKLDRKDGPAGIYYNKNGTVDTETWYMNGLKHRDNAPAVTHYYENGNKKEEIWWKNGVPDRRDGPMRTIYYPNGKVFAVYWERDNKPYKKAGPAIVYYYDNGNVMVELFYKDGITTKKRYNINGELEKTTRHKDPDRNITNHR